MNYLGIVLATISQFILGALWYSPLLFGKVWMQIMEVGHHSKEELQKLQKQMVPFYSLQFFLTLITTWVLAANLAFSQIVGPAAYFYAFFMWLGYTMPVGVSAVIWGNTHKKYWLKQISVMVGMQFVTLMLATFILTNI